MLSDRGIDATHAPIPSLLAVAAVHHHLISVGRRTQCELVLETGEPRETHHFAVLVGYGAGAINPYLALESLHELREEGVLDRSGSAEATEERYLKAIDKGIIKVMSKMGISTVSAYRGAQIFEAVGLGRDLIDTYFTGTASRIGGIGLSEIEADVRRRHARAYPDREIAALLDLPVGGVYHWRRDGEHHMFNPQTIALLQEASSRGRYDIYKQFAALIDGEAAELCTIRGLLQFKPGDPIPLDEVEPADDIVRRFATGAISFGSISTEAHESLAIAMNRIGAKSNTGEGGEDPARYVPDANGDRRASAIKQVASGRFGVTSNYLTNATDIQIKMAQGAKPGEGGQLPGHKVDENIARVRHSTPGVELISPPPHHDIYSIEDLAELIHDLKNANPEARIHVKLVSEVGVGTIAAGVSKGHGDVVLNQRRQRRHRRIAGVLDQARGAALGAGRRRDPAGAGPERPAQPHRRADRWAAEDRPRRGHRLPAGRGGVRLRDGPAGHAGLHHAAQVPPQRLLGGHRHPGPRVRAHFRGDPEHVIRYLPLHRPAPARDHGRARLPHDQRDGRAGRHAGAGGDAGPLADVGP